MPSKTDIPRTPTLAEIYERWLYGSTVDEFIGPQRPTPPKLGLAFPEEAKTERTHRP